MESAFYQYGISTFGVDAFAKAGYATFVRARYEQIVANEQKHVELLTGALVARGAKPVETCTYALYVLFFYSWWL
jgi:hypothetical protein